MSHELQFGIIPILHSGDFDDPNLVGSITTPTVSEILPPILDIFVEPVEAIFGETGGEFSSQGGSQEGSANTAPALEGNPAVGGTARFIIGGVGAAVGIALLLSIF